jgi:hypothetical protein
MTLEPSKLLEGLFDKKKMSLIKLFLDSPEREFGLREAAKAARVPPATTHRILRVLVKLEVVEERKVRQLRLYKLDQNKATKFLDELLAIKKTAMEEFLEEARLLPGVESIIQYGTPTKEKASVIIIGENVDTANLSRIVGEIKEKYRFGILQTILPSFSYEQMSAMGLFTGEKKVLFRREG